MRINKAKSFKKTKLINVKQLKDIPKEHRFTSILNERDKLKAIKKIEMIVRSSAEYKEYVKYLREYVNMNKCHFFSGITKENGRKVSIEIHHEPFTLFDISKIVLEKWVYHDEDINLFLISEEIMKLHYQNRVGLIPLTSTVHELVHNGKIFIPIQDVYGKGFIDFIAEYDDFIDQDLRKILNDKIDISRDIIQEDNLSILDKNYVYLEIEGITMPSLTELQE